MEIIPNGFIHEHDEKSAESQNHKFSSEKLGLLVD